MRITESVLKKRIEYLNSLTNSAETPYKRVDGKLIANVGNFHLSCAYGAVSLHRMANESGGVDSVFNCGYIPKKELYWRINAYIQALMDVKYHKIDIKGHSK